MKASLSIVFTGILVSGCAAEATYTTNTVAAQEAAYRDCVRANANANIYSFDSATEVAWAAGVKCQGQLVIINDKLRQENGWRPYYGSFAYSYTESLRETTVTEVTEEIRSKRTR